MLTVRSLNSPAVAATVLGGAGQGMMALLGLVGAVHGVASTANFANTSAVLALGLTAVGPTLPPRPPRVGGACAADQSMALGWPPGKATRFVRLAVLAALVTGILYVQEWSGKGGSPHLVMPLGLLSFALGLGLLILTGIIFAGRNKAADILHFTSAGLFSGVSLLMAVSVVFSRTPWFQVALAAIVLALFAGLTWARWRGAQPPLNRQRNLVLILAGLAAAFLVLWFMTPWVSLLLAPLALLVVWLERALFLSRLSV